MTFAARPNNAVVRPVLNPATRFVGPAFRPPQPEDDTTKGIERAVSLWNYTGIIYQNEEHHTGAAVWNPLPPALPGDLPTKPVSAYGTRLLNFDYCGACLVVERANDLRSKSIGFLDDGTIDWHTLRSFLAGTTGRVTTLYDQFGDVHLTRTENCAGPAIDLRLKTGTSPYLIFDNGVGFQHGYHYPAPGLAVSLSNQDGPTLWPMQAGCSFVVSGRVFNANNSLILSMMRLGIKEAHPFHIALGYDGFHGPLSVLYGVGTPISRVSPSLTASVFGVSIQPGGTDLIGLVRGEYLRTVTKVPINGGPDGMTGIEIGTSADGPHLGVPWAMDAILIYNTGLSQAKMQDVRASLIALWNHIPQVQDVLIADGDSIEAGAGSTLCQTPGKLLEPFLPPITIINAGAGGATIANRTAALTETLTLFPPQNIDANRVLLFEAAVNSICSYIGSGQTESEAYANAYLDTRKYVDTVRQFNPGIKIVLCTVFPFNGYNMRHYNELVRANTAGADAISDRASSPINERMGESRGPNNYISDECGHLTDLSYTHIVPYDVAAINSLLQVV